jgi:hypothetical protein
VILTARAESALLRWAKVMILSAGFLLADGAVTFLSGNALGLAPVYQSLVMALVVPMLVGIEKWASWEKTQP